MSTMINDANLAPHSIEAEEAVLGSIGLNPDALAEVGSLLQSEDFFLVRHSWIWDAMQAVTARGEPLDYLTIVTELEQRGRLSEVGGASYVIGLINKTPSALNVAGYGQIVKRMATRRRLLEAAQQVARLAHSDETDIDDVLDRSQAALAGVVDKHIRVRETDSSAYGAASEVIDSVSAWHANPTDIRGMETGLAPLDMAVSGIEVNTLTYLAGRPGSGKSALLDQLAAGLAEHKHPTLIFSLEMSKSAVMLRMACQIAHVDSRMAKAGRLTDSQRSDLNKALGKLAELPLDILPLTAPTMSEMQAQARQYVRRRGVQVVMVDTINRVKSSGKSPYERMTMKSNEAADWAHGAPIALIAAVQMSRQSEQRSNKQPELSDLRDSGELEQDADGVWGIYRPGYYEPENAELAHLAELHILKNREGEAGGLIRLYWEPTWPGFARLKVTSMRIEPAPTYGQGGAEREWHDPITEVVK